MVSCSLLLSSLLTLLVATPPFILFTHISPHRTTPHRPSSPFPGPSRVLLPHFPSSSSSPSSHSIHRPIDFGADLVCHSTTKLLSGHGNALGGCIVDSGKFDWGADPEKFPSLGQPEPAYNNITFAESFGDLAFTTFAHAVGLRDLGCTMAPLHAYLTLNAIETLPLRMEKHVSNTKVVAEWLSTHPKVAWVSYSGLHDSPHRACAEKYTPRGAGSMFTIGLKGGYEAGVRAVERCELFSHLANIGDTRSLILHPASTTHGQLTPEQRAQAGAGDDTLRISIGLEDPKDLMKDLDYAMSE